MRISSTSNYHVTLGFKAKDDIENAQVFVSGGMKTIIKPVLCLQMTALLLTTALAGPASAQEMVPFLGTIQGTEDFNFLVDDPDGIDLKIHGSGEGISTQLGLEQFTATWDGDIIFANPDNPIVRTFVAANGVDMLFAEGPGAGTPPAAGIQLVTEMMTITGGEGLFEFAGGEFTIQRVVSEVGVPEGNFNDLPTTGTFDGFITIIPEPASMSLALLGCLFLGLVTRCRPKGR